MGRNCFLSIVNFLRFLVFKGVRDFYMVVGNFLLGNLIISEGDLRFNMNLDN